MATPGTSLGKSTPTFGSIRAGLLLFGFAFFAIPVFAQQAGDISGRVTDSSGAPVAGVAVEASSNVLPQNRSTTSATNGRYRMPLLPPGNYELTFTFSDGSTAVRTTSILLAAGKRSQRAMPSRQARARRPRTGSST
jgi:hypothetical protein